MGRRTLQLFMSVNNLLGEDPPVIALGPAGSANETPATNQSLCDVLGRTYRLGLRFSI